MNGLTLCDWELAIAAHVYERGGSPTMTDQCYDRMSRSAKERGTNLPGFEDYTGSWIDSMDRDLLDKLYDWAMALNRGWSDLHGPAIKAALDKYGVEYTCCTGLPCWAPEQNTEENTDGESTEG